MKVSLESIADAQEKKVSQLLREMVDAYVRSYTAGSPDFLAIRNEQEKAMRDQIANQASEIESLTGRLEGAAKELEQYVEMAGKYIEHSAQFAKNIRDLYKLFNEDIDVESVFWAAGNDSPEVIKGIYDAIHSDIKSLQKDFKLRVELCSDIMNTLQYTDTPYNIPHYLSGVLQGHENLLTEIIRKAHISGEGDIPETSEHNALSKVKRLKEYQASTHLSMEVATVKSDRTSKILARICRLFVQTDAALTAMRRRNWWQRLFNKVAEAGERRY